MPACWSVSSSKSSFGAERADLVVRVVEGAPSRDSQPGRSGRTSELSSSSSRPAASEAPRLLATEKPPLRERTATRNGTP